jgi:polyamine oxidase
VDYSDLFNTFEDAYANFEQDAGYVLTQNLQDRSARTGFSLAGWSPRMNAQQQTIEWFEFDFEYGETPERSSHQWSVINFNTTFYQYSDANNFVFDPRGFSTFISGEAATFLKKNDPRLLLNTIVTSIDHSASGVTIHTKNGGCIAADYAIMTFSVGVLQSDAVAFSPALPAWKRTAIESMDMSTYTKIFLQFPADQVFWNKSTQFFLYADPVERGNYPLFQSLDAPGFLPGSGILFVTVVQDQSFAAERQSEATTQAQVMAVLRKMFPHKSVPDPIAFMYPKWSTEPWAYGSYSNWPVGLTLEGHENLRAPVDRLWFAGEATSAEYYGFLQGAYFEGQAAGTAIAECINGNKSACAADAQYDTLHGPSPYSQYAVQNGWTVSPFLTYGFDG